MNLDSFYIDRKRFGRRQSKKSRQIIILFVVLWGFFCKTLPILNIYTHTYKYYTSCCNAVKSNKSIKTGCSTSQCSCETVWHKATLPIYTCHIFIGWAVPIKNKNTTERYFFPPLLVGSIHAASYLRTLKKKINLSVLMREVCFSKCMIWHFYV